MTSYNWAYSGEQDKAVAGLKPKDSVGKLSPLEAKLKASASNEKLPHELRDASAQLLDNMHEMGPAIYHHHYHSAIVGRTDAPFRYNRKWMNENKISGEKNLTNNIGQIKTNDFLLGQGGIYHKTEVP